MILAEALGGMRYNTMMMQKGSLRQERIYLKLRDVLNAWLGHWLALNERLDACAGKGAAEIRKQHQSGLNRDTTNLRLNYD